VEGDACRMNGYLPPPAVRLIRRQTHIVLPSLIEEFDGTIWKTAPRHRGDGIDHHLERIVGVPHFVERRRQRTVPLQIRECLVSTRRGWEHHRTPSPKPRRACRAEIKEKLAGTARGKLRLRSSCAGGWEFL